MCLRKMVRLGIDTQGGCSGDIVYGLRFILQAIIWIYMRKPGLCILTLYATNATIKVDLTC